MTWEALGSLTAMGGAETVRFRVEKLVKQTLSGRRLRFQDWMII